MILIRPLEQGQANDMSIAGSKAANLGELTSAGYPVPQDFVMPTQAYQAFVRTNGLQA